MELPARPRPVTDLAARGRWLRRPALQLALPGALASILYALWTTSFPSRAYPGFLFIALATLLALGLASEVWARARLSTLRQLSAGRLPPTQEHFRAAIQEVFCFPDRLFLQGLLFWLSGGLAMGVGAWALERVPPLAAARLPLVGLLFGPLLWLLVTVRVTLRVRQLLGELVQLGRIAPEQLREMLPRRKVALRARVVIFTAVAALSATAITADAARALSGGSVERVLSQHDPAQQLEVARAERGYLLGGVGVLLGLIFGLAMLVASAAGKALAEPLREAALEAERLARGELSAPRVVVAEDELWAVTSSFGVMHDRLREVLVGLRRAGVRLGDTCEQIVKSAGGNEAGARAQAKHLSEVSSTTEELAQAARLIAENATAVSEMAARTLSAAEQGSSSAEIFSSSVERMREDNQVIAASVAKLSTLVAQIGRIVELIHGVADRADFLALSAELEGTKAGEVGRGFSLVAAQMRRLAENVVESTHEIQLLIEEIRQATELAVQATSVGVGATEGGTELAQSVSDALRTIVELARRTSEAVRAISLAIQQQQSGTGQLAETMGQVLRLTEERAATSRQTGRTNLDLSSLAEDLRKVVERFRVE